MALFTQDEALLEVVVKIPANYPLTVPEVNGTRRSGIEEKRWRSFMLGMHSMLLLCNGKFLFFHLNI